MCEFKVGDYVACGINKYGITVKNRPCVVNAIYDDIIEVYCVGEDTLYNVAKKHFYKLNYFKPLAYKDTIIWKSKKYKFEGYSVNGVILNDGFNRVTAPYKEISTWFKGLFI